MTDTKHTPGPWAVCDGTGIVPVDEPDDIELTGPMYIAQALGKYVTPDQQRANAYLIAAAPELLDALEKIVFDWDGEPEDMQDARDAIAKAKGTGQ